jgi:rhomboid family GlyGly-CTERM serine protease
MALVLLLGVFPAWATPLLELNRDAVGAGEWWRLLTGHLVHYGLYHLAMNLLALALIGYVFLRRLNAVVYLGLLLVCSLVVSLGLLLGTPELHYYAGFSGVLHGLLLAGLLLTLRETPVFNTGAMAVILFKLWREQQPDFDTTHALLPVDIAVDAHLYGALAGLVYGLLLLTHQYLYSRR